MTPSGSFFMEDYSEIIIPVSSEEQSSLFIASLTALGFEGFVEEATILKAYIPTSLLNQAEFNNWCTRCEVLVQQNLVKPNNWNQQWESNFQPVKVENFAVVRASFHNPIGGVEHDIIINPKMSFGTGHHATTYMMIDQMRGIDFWHKRVLDFGTGTGVLAILSKKMGATYVAAIDNDSWSIENATENIQLNDTAEIVINCAAYPPSQDTFDVILANINKSVLLRFISNFHSLLTPNGLLLLSGFLRDDVEDLSSVAQTNGFIIEHFQFQNEWVLLRLKRQ
jgi:ribosomal protein L11 methyltransferase